MLVNCKTDRALILVPLDGGNGLWMFPSDPGPWAGLHLQVQPLMPILPQIADMIRSRLGFALEPAGYQVCPDFEDIVMLESKIPATLYVVQSENLKPTGIIPADPSRPLRLATLPEWLGRLPQERQRLSWLRAWQIYQGILVQNIKAVEAVEALEALKALAQREQQP